MTNRVKIGMVLSALIVGLAGCGGSDASTTPLAPSPSPAPQAPPPPPGFFYGHGYVLTGVTLFGVVSEVTATGQTPLADVSVYCDACGAFGHSWARTDASGNYSFSGDLSTGGGVWLLSGRPTPLIVAKEGYQDPPGSATSPFGPGWREVLVNGDTRLDVELVRR